MGVGCIGAGGDGGNDHIAVADGCVLSLERDIELTLGDRPAGFGPAGRTAGFVVELGHMAQIGIPVVVATQHLGKGLFHQWQRDPVLGRAGPAREGATVAQIELDHAAVLGDVGFTVKQTDGLGIGLGQLRLFLPVGHHQILNGFFVDGEKSGGGAIFGRHVGNRGAIGDRQRLESRARNIPRNSPPHRGCAAIR